METSAITKANKIKLLEEFYSCFGREPKLNEEYKGVKIANFFRNVRKGHTKVLKSDRNYLENFGIRIS